MPNLQDDTMSQLSGCRKMSQIRTLSPKQHKAIEALLLTGSVALAAEQAHCTRDSIYRWSKQPEFARALREAEAEALEAVSRRLLRLAFTAVDTLDTAMTDEASPAANRVRGAS